MDRTSWFIEGDISRCFDTVPWNLVVRAVQAITDCPWVLLYVKRWLAAPLQHPDGALVERDKGTSRGSAVSPVLANLFMHFAFDLWMDRSSRAARLSATPTTPSCTARAGAKRRVCGTGSPRGWRRWGYGCTSTRRKSSTANAPRGALLYSRRSREELEGMFLGLMAYPDLKSERDSSLPGKRRSCPGVRGGALRGPRDMAKAGLPEAESPEDAKTHPPERHPKPAPCSAMASLQGRRNLRDVERCPVRVIKEMCRTPKSRSDVQQGRTRDQPSGREPQGDGVPIVVVRLQPFTGSDPWIRPEAVWGPAVRVDGR